MGKTKVRFESYYKINYGQIWNCITPIHTEYNPT